MKRLMAILFTLCFCVSLCACNKQTKAKVILDNGSILQLTSKEVYNNFGQYHDADIRISAKVVNIECIPMNTLYSGWLNHYQITLEGGWLVYALSETVFLPLCIDVGDTITIDGCMYRREGPQVMILAFYVNGTDVT